MITNVLNLNRQTVHEILIFELDMQKICAKLVPKILTNEQKENGRNVCLDLLERIENYKHFFKSSCDFFLFPKLKFHLKVRHFGTVDDIQKVVTDQLRALLHEDFQHCYREWE